MLEMLQTPLTHMSTIEPNKQKIKDIFYHAYKRPLDTTGRYGLCDWLNIQKFTTSQKIADLQDKLKVKEYVKKVCPDLRTAEVFWEGDYIVNAWNELPRKFMLKANHGKDLNWLIDKDKVGIGHAQKLIDLWMSTDFGSITEERNYSLITPKAFAEEYLENKNHESGLPDDYKFWTFHGKPGFLQLNVEGKWTGDHFDDRRIECYDPYTGERLPQRYYYRNADNPVNVDIPPEMLNHVEMLSKELDFVRVDFFFVNDIVYFAELTMIPGCGYVPIMPIKLENVWANVINKRLTVEKALEIVKQIPLDHEELQHNYPQNLSEEEIRNFIKV